MDTTIKSTPAEILALTERTERVEVAKETRKMFKDLHDEVIFSGSDAVVAAAARRLHLANELVEAEAMLSGLAAGLRAAMQMGDLDAVLRATERMMSAAEDVKTLDLLLSRSFSASDGRPENAPDANAIQIVISTAA